MNYKYLIITLLFTTTFFAQVAKEVAPPDYIKTITFKGNTAESQLPVLKLGEYLQLEFDALNGNEEDFYYVIEHYNYDWTPSVLSKIEYPECSFHLVDSINKKLNVVREVAEGLGLENVKTTHCRVEEIKDTYDFIVSRAVAAMPTFVHWVKGRVAKKQNHELKNGIIYLKGGDLAEELQDYPKATIFNIPDYYTEDFFETKKIVHLPLKYKG